MFSSSSTTTTKADSLQTPAVSTNTTKMTNTCFEEAPSSRQLRIVALHAAIPMVGFGFMDNWLMIQAGDAIDMSLGVTFGLATLTTAALGNIFSDVAGVFFGDAVEAFVAKLHLPQHGLSRTQLDMKVTRMYNTMGGTVGIITGCILGMTCLLFMDTDRATKAKKAKELQTIFESIMTEGHELVNAERATLWMFDEERNKLWSRFAVGTKGIIRVPADSGIVGACVTSGDTIRVSNVYNDNRFNQSIDQSTGYHTKSVLVMPVREKDSGKIIAVVQMLNKRDPRTGAHVSFTEADEDIVHLLATHVETFIRTVNGRNDRS